MDTEKLGNPFRLLVPVTLDKSGDTDDRWKIKGLASTSHKDIQDEIVVQKGLDISPIKQGRGWINFNHSNDPEDMVGKLDDADITENGLVIEGYLFKKHKKAQNIYAILKSLDEKDQHAIKLSIEGNILKRSGKDNKTIASAKVDKVAITFDPINTYTYVELAKALVSKTKEYNMLDVPDYNPNDNPIHSTGEKHIDEPANASMAPVSESMVGKEDSIENPTVVGKGQDNVYDLLVQIKDMLSVLVQREATEKANKDRSDLIKSLSKVMFDRVKIAINDK